MENVYAHTEMTREGYPAYVSLNEHLGSIRLTVRSRGHGGTQSGSMYLSRTELEEMALNILQFLKGTR